AMEATLAYARSTYDLVVVDTPPLPTIPDAYSMLGQVDGVIIATWVGRSRRDLSRRLHDALEGSGATQLGVIANGVKPRDLISYVGAPRQTTGAGHPHRTTASPNGSSQYATPAPPVGS